MYDASWKDRSLSRVILKSNLMLKGVTLVNLANLLRWNILLLTEAEEMSEVLL